MSNLSAEATAMIIVRDIVLGIQGHFRARVTEWIMSFPMGAITIGFMLQPDMFSMSGAYNVVASWGNERAWMFVMGICFLLRMTALIVNGTFKQFRKSPHLRCFASLVCFYFWGFVSIGFTLSFISGAGAFFASPACITLCMIEGLNVFRAATDIRAHHEDLKRTGQWTGGRQHLKRR